jgi:hypothetical protein
MLPAVGIKTSWLFFLGVCNYQMQESLKCIRQFKVIRSGTVNINYATPKKVTLKELLKG